MKNKFPFKYHKLAAALLLVAPLGVANAAAPVFVDNSVLENNLEFLFNPVKGNSEYLSLAVDSHNNIFTSYQNAVGAADIVNVAKFSDGQAPGIATGLGALSSVKTDNTFTQMGVKSDDSLITAYVEAGKLIVKTSADGTVWQEAANQAVTATSKALKMAVGGDDVIYLLHAGSDNNSTVYKLDGDQLTTIYGPVATKSNNNFTVGADIAVNSKNEPVFVYRDFATGATKNKTLLVTWDELGQANAPLITTAAPTSAYLELAYDSQDNLHMFTVGYNASAGGSIYKLDGSDPADSSWALVGTKNFTFDLATDYAGGVIGSPVIDLAISADDSVYAAFQQMNNGAGTPKQIQMVKLDGGAFTEVTYDLAANSKDGATASNAVHNFVSLETDSYNRPIVLYRASGATHNSYGYGLRANLVAGAAENVLEFSTNEGSVAVGNAVVIDADGDALSLTLSGEHGDLFTIDSQSGEINFKEIQSIQDSDSTYNVTITATDGGNTTTQQVVVTLVNDASNDVIDSDNDGVIDEDDAFPNDPTEQVDSDEDGVGDNADYYPNDPTRTVIEDNDEDGIENSEDPDDDNDGVLDVDDAFPFDATERSDYDRDGTGDNADLDDDNDGVLDVDDAFPFDVTESQDTDNDGVGDNADYYPEDPSRFVSEDFDADGLDNDVDPDDDNDGVLDADDLFPFNENESADNDGDNIGDNADLDDDNDGVLDVDDAFPFDDSESVDADEDGVGDNADTDDDNDGVNDDSDLYPLDPTESNDNDLDGIGDNADLDDDNDGVIDTEDEMPFDPLETFDNDMDGIGDNADLDDDNDGVVDVDDEFPFDASESLDSDKDGVGNNADLDDDNDGIEDINDAMPLDPNESVDSDMDGVGDNSDVFPNDPSESKDSDDDGLGDNIDPNPNNSNDLTGPRFASDIPVVTIDAQGLLTDIEPFIIAQNINADDLFDGEVISQIDTTDLVLSSGKHTIVLSATDLAGNKTEQDVVVDIKPIVSTGGVVKVVPGGTVHLPVSLSGMAANYPLQISYTVDSLVEVSGEPLIFEEGSQFANLTLNVADSAIAGDEIVVTLTASEHAVIADNTQLKVVVDVINYAPTVDIMVTQGGLKVNEIAPELGDVTLTAIVHDVNESDTHQVNWHVVDALFSERVDDAVTDESNEQLPSADDSQLNTFVFDPTMLESGTYQVEITVMEASTGEQLSTSITQVLQVNTDLIDLSVDEDADGIVDSLDSNMNAMYLPIDGEQFIQTTAGLTLSLGDIAKKNGNVTASLESTELEVDHHYVGLSALNEFVIKGLTTVGNSVAVVLPLPADMVIPENALYRKYTNAHGWFTFAEDEYNSIGSAEKDDAGNCPAPNDAEYFLEDEETANGLIANNECIQLIIEDGGQNDADGLVNGVIADPGLLTVEGINSLPLITAFNAAGNSGDAIALRVSAEDAENDAVSFSWVQLTGPAVTLSATDGSEISFIAPSVSKLTELTFEVFADDGRDVTSEIVTVTITTVAEEKPEADLHRHSGSFSWYALCLIGIGLMRRRLKRIIRR